MSENQELRRFDASHKETITVSIQETDGELEGLVNDLGITILTTDSTVAEWFGEFHVATPDEINEAESCYEEDASASEVILWLVKNEGIIRVMPEPAELSGHGEDLGILIFSADAWNRYFRNVPYVTNVAASIAERLINPRLQLNANKRLWQAEIETEHGNFIRDGYYSPKSALRDAMAEFPHIKYEESDFNANHQLKPGR